jgi:ferredoxin/truncated hemoglobin YjbI
MKAVPIRLEEATFEVRRGESLLDACLRSAVTIPFSCRGGVCHTCLLRCVEGEVPAQAQRGLPHDLRSKHYLLACQCHPTGPLELARALGADRTTPCVLHEADAAGPYLHLRFEVARTLPCKPGQRLRILTGAEPQPEMEVTRYWPKAFLLECLLRPQPGASLPEWLVSGLLGCEFEVAGPLDPASNAADAAAELSSPEPDPALWHELEDGTRVRAVLEDFYALVYQDEQLAPFFQGVTLSRSVDKQYSFLRQLMTGERVYFGDRPRNAHHWMVISDELFDYRQSLMQSRLGAHGLTDAQIARWTRLELHYRSDIVKSAAFARRVGGVDLPLDGYGRQVLDVGSVCDHCGSAVDAGTEVAYHLRLGQISCGACTGSGA